MVITGRKGRGKGDVKIIRIEGEEDKEREVIVCHETVPRKNERSMWSWQEEFAIEWSESLITRKREKTSKTRG
jgi:hypothetical protein